MSGPDDAAVVSFAWTSAVGQLGGDLTTAADVVDDLIARYGESHRRFHNLGHVAAVVRYCRVLAHEAWLDPDECAVLALAACAHDVVYEAKPRADEMASAAWASDALIGLPIEHVDRVTQLVLNTINHVALLGDKTAEVLLDADLAILASRHYDAYARGVRAEYFAASDEQWRVGRADVLRGLLARPALYLTYTAHERWEAAARRNLSIELATLGG